MSKMVISAEHAAKLLPRGKKVHTFIRVFAWMGADVDRTRILAAFESAKEVEISPDAACLPHHLFVELDGMRTYVDTNPKALRRLHPQVAVA
ncbi:hypothetical protein ACIP1U_16225 [Cupriavidus sp. NPDC089707]|uniref:hypothetical protein n=1 Tax=Cupriavidus sp. NPDC089707 TaxID=3363963 RepID=UPI0037FB1F1C